MFRKNHFLDVLLYFENKEHPLMFSNKVGRSFQDLKGDSYRVLKGNKIEIVLGREVIGNSVGCMTFCSEFSDG